MDYIKEIRQLIGHRPLQIIGATVFVIDSQNRLLLLKRVDNRCWGPPGGTVELGEVVDKAAARETLEETGLMPCTLSLYGVYSGPEQYYKYPNGDEVYFANIAYLCRDFQGQVQISEEHTDWRWFRPDDLPVEISPPIIPMLGDLLPHLKEGKSDSCH